MTAQGCRLGANAMASQFKHQLCPKYPEILDSLRAPSDIGDGWFGLVGELCALLSQDVIKTGEPCKASQVKEKLGELRVRCAIASKLLGTWAAEGALAKTGPSDGQVFDDFPGEHLDIWQEIGEK
jgi:hypothetical protein